MKFDNRFLIVVIGAIGLYAIFLIVSDFTTISNKVIHFKTQFLPIILTLVPCSWLALSTRWILLLRHSNVRIPFMQSLKIFLAGYALTVTPGRVGELVKSQLIMTKFGASRTITAPLVLVERLYDLTGAVAVSFIGIWILKIGGYVIIVFSIILFLAFVIIASRKVFNKFLDLFGRIKFLSKLLKLFSESYEVIRSSSRGRIALLASVLSIIAWLLESLAVYFVLLGFGIDNIHYLNVVTTYTSAVILGAASFIPGGIGVAEGSLVGLLNYQGVNISDALVLVVLIRIFTLWYGVAVGFVALKLSGGLSMKTKHG